MFSCQSCNTGQAVKLSAAVKTVETPASAA